jgi:hypothetical protein
MFLHQSKSFKDIYFEHVAADAFVGGVMLLVGFLLAAYLQL